MTQIVVSLSTAILSLAVLSWLGWPRCDGRLQGRADAMVREVERRWGIEGWHRVKRANEEAHPIGWMQAEQVAREALKRRLDLVYGTNASIQSKDWSMVKVTCVRKEFRFDYELADGEGNGRSCGLSVEFDEQGSPSLRAR